MQMGFILERTSQCLTVRLLNGTFSICTMPTGIFLHSEPVLHKGKRHIVRVMFITIVPNEST